ncbi:MAG: GGDEF domain-containing protein [Clostridiales bacterium]|nr:GGDEF domain-containing protein [Clostridiales bacterium]
MKTINRQFFICILIGLLAFVVFFGFLFHFHISDILMDTKQKQEDSAYKMAIRLEEKLHQSRECLEMLATNPVIGDGDPRCIEDLLTNISSRSPLYRGLIVTNHDGYLIAEAPQDLKFSCPDINKLRSLLTKCDLAYITIADKKEHVFVSAAQVSNPKDKGQIIIALLDLDYVAETAILENNSSEISIYTGSDTAKILYTPEYSPESYPIPAILNIIGRTIKKKASPYLVGTASMTKPNWDITIIKSFEAFLYDSMQTASLGFRFFSLLSFPILITLLFTILIINFSRKHLKELAIRDGLTNLYNHRFFQTELRNIISSNKYKEISLLMIDLDNFKLYNDCHGHLAGDEVLKDISRIFVQNIRNTDIAARYGGEEFAIILPDVGLEEATKIAERIRKTIKSNCPCTISIGISSFPKYASTAEELISRADDALYRAKNISKDRVEKC